MRNKKILIAGLIAFVCTTFLAAQTNDDIPISIQRLSERVLILSETLMSNNVVAISAEKGIVVVDTSGLPSTAAKMRRIIEEEFGRSDFAYVINTHSHWDHTFGNQVFPDAVIIGHENVISGMEQDEEILPRRIVNLEGMIQKETSRLSSVPAGSEEAKNIQDFLRDIERQSHDFKNVFISIPPQITFDDRMVLDLGDITVRLDYFGRAHSTSDIFIHVPEEGILITGDVFLDQRWVPLFAGQPELDIDRWLEVLHRALDGDDAPSRVIPAHKDIWKAEKLVLWRDYIQTLWEGLKKAKEQGLNLEEARERFPLPEPYYYLRERGHSDERILTFHANNIEAFWSQLFISAADIIEEILTDRGLEGLEEAERKFQELKSEPDKYLISEREFNSLGYRLLQQNKLPHAVAVFRMNVESFPQSGNVYDSLAEAYLLLGDKDKTIRYYKKSLDHDPQNENARSRLERMDELFEEYHPTTSEDVLFSAWEQTGLKGPYFGQKIPVVRAEVFMDGIISTLNEDEMCAAFTADGREFYFNARHGGNWTIFMTKEAAGEWVKPAPMPFTSDYTDRDFTLSPDGKKIFFGSNRPRSKGSGPLESLDIFVTKRRAQGRWSDPENIGDPINTDRSENYPSCARNGNLYFFTSRTDGFGGCDIYVSRWENGRYSLPENLGPEINSDKHDWDAFIAPDESFILFSSQNRADSIGQQDLYISYKNEDGGWTAAKNMGPSVNSPEDEICPSLSADGKCLFFTSRRRGRADIYWIDARIIEELRPKK
jgi:glyoxylase-like metal-dependent hydrolase (beta-lactamase superfamily II)/Tol biopolymer transport system component